MSKRRTIGTSRRRELGEPQPRKVRSSRTRAKGAPQPRKIESPAVTPEPEPPPGIAASETWKRPPAQCITNFHDLLDYEQRIVLRQWNGSSIITSQAVAQIIAEHSPAERISGWADMPSAERERALTAFNGDYMDGAEVAALVERVNSTSETDE